MSRRIYLCVLLARTSSFLAVGLSVGALIVEPGNPARWLMLGVTVCIMIALTIAEVDIERRR